MAYLIHIGLALLAQVLWEESSFSGPTRSWLVIAVCFVPHALGALARRLYLTGKFSAADRVFGVLSWSPVALHAICVFNGGWITLLESWTGHPMRLMGWPSLWTAMSFLPFVAYSMLAIDARARLGAGSIERIRRARNFQARLLIASLAPMLGYVVISAALGVIDPLRMRIETVAVWNAAYATTMLLLFAAGIPWLLRNSWETEPMPQGVERSLLEGVAQLADFDGRRLFIWRTNNSVANAAIVGLFPRHRVVLFSDLLLSQLDLRELASVFAHEIGHAKKNHVLIFGAWALAALFGADLLARKLAPDDVAWNAAVLCAAMVVWAVGFGWMSRRSELEADMYSLRLLGQPGPLIGALEKVSGPHGQARTSWRHFSTLRRIEFLEAMSRDPAVGERLERRLAWFARVGFIAFTVVMSLEGLAIARQWPREQMLLGLRTGNYTDAARRLEDEPETELAPLVQRAAMLRTGDLAEIERMARSAISSRDSQAMAEWLYLGELRGDEQMGQVGRLLADLSSDPSQDIEPLLARAPERWRDALERLLDSPAH